MKPLQIVLSWLLFLWVGSARADWISEWGGNTLGVHYDITQAAGIITILQGNGRTFKFYSETAEGSGVPGSINNVFIDPGATGDFSLLIDHPNAGQPGALHLRAGDLRLAGGVCTVAGIDLAGDLCMSPGGAGDPRDFYCQVVVGSIRVGGSLSPPLAVCEVDLVRKFVADEVYGTIELGGMIGDIEIGEFDGDLIVHDTPCGATRGDVRIGSDFFGSMAFTDVNAVGYNGRISIDGDMAGSLVFSGPMFGSIVVGSSSVPADLVAPGRILFESYLARSSGGQPPSIEVFGSIVGSGVGGAPLIEVSQDVNDGGLRGTIAIRGSLNDAVAGPEILVWTIQAGALGAIAIDYDGWDAADNWAVGATIKECEATGPPQVCNTYSASTPAQSVFEINNCLGDMDGDGQFGSYDLPGVNYARTYHIPSEPSGFQDRYVDCFPGLEGSYLWHGDLNGDSSVDCVDVDWMRHLMSDSSVPSPCCLTGATFEQAVSLSKACRADFNRNGTVDLPDLSLLLTYFGTSSGAIASGQPRPPSALPDFNYVDCGSGSVFLACDLVPGATQRLRSCFLTGPGCEGHTNAVDLADLSTLLSIFGSSCPCFDDEGGGGFAPGNEGERGAGDSGSDQGDGGETDDAEFVEWVRSATVDEILEWWAQQQFEAP